VGLDVAAIDLAGFRDPAFCRQRRQNARLDAPAAPPVRAIIDRRRGAVFGRAIRPEATAFENVNDTGDYPAIIDPPRFWLVPRQVGFDRAPCFIRQPEQRTRHQRGLLPQRRLPESMCAPIFKSLIGLDPNKRAGNLDLDLPVRFLLLS